MKIFDRILVPVDFGPGSSHALELAIDLARRFDAKVTLLHVVSLPAPYTLAYAEGLSWPVNELDTAAKRELDAVRRQAEKKYSNVETVVVSGDPREQIVEVAREANMDLIVMATNARRGLARAFLGSVAERVVRTAPVPVLTVGPETTS